MADKLMSEGTQDTKQADRTLGTTAFDLTEWLEGRGRATRTVRIYGSLDLFGEREELGYQLEAARATRDNDAVQNLKEKIDELTVRMQEDVLDIRLQSLTQSRLMEMREELAALDLDDPVEMTMLMLTNYVVEPEGLSAEQLLALAEWSPAQMNKVVEAMNQLTDSVPHIGATRPF